MKKVIETIKTVLIIALIFALLFDVEKFFLNFHNVDEAYNFMSLLGNGITDIGSDGMNRPIDDYYRSGINGIRDFFMLGLLEAFCLAWLLADKCSKKDKLNELWG